MPSHYIGRFAPSPTGPLHFGSLIAAVGSYLQAHQQHGQWQVRMEDLDPPREVAGAADNILRTLERYGFQWHGPVIYQSQRSDAYDDALATLGNQGHSFACSCTRKDILKAGGIYPGTCRNGAKLDTSAHAIRLNTQNAHIEFRDGLQGTIKENLEKEVGDFVLHRADGLYAYQLAVVVDDAEQGITEIVRGKDLLSSTPRQIFLQQQLNVITPHYIHLPIALNASGEKLSKQTYAAALPEKDRGKPLFKALQFLGQNPPDKLQNDSVHNIWSWAFKHWNLLQVPPSQT